MSADKPSGGEARSATIMGVQNALAFFALIVLVLEVILGMVAARVTGWDLTLLLCGMLALVFVLVWMVASGRHLPVEQRAKASELKKHLETLEQQNETLRTNLEKATSANEALQAQLGRLASIKPRLWAALHQSKEVSLPMIFAFLDIDKENSTEKQQVTSLLGSLIAEGKVRRSGANPGYYVAAE